MKQKDRTKTKCPHCGVTVEQWQIDGGKHRFNMKDWRYIIIMGSLIILVIILGLSS